eukprot:4644353-Prymnesium_polylepis.1
MYKAAVPNVLRRTRPPRRRLSSLVPLTDLDKNCISIKSLLAAGTNATKQKSELQRPYSTALHNRPPPHKPATHVRRRSNAAVDAAGPAASRRRLRSEACSGSPVQ